VSECIGVDDSVTPEPSIEVIMRRPIHSRALAAMALFLSLHTGCSEDPAVGAGDEQDLTLQDGSKYVASASAAHIVLRKKVGDRPLAVTAEELPGKAVLIYPMKGAAEAGVFSWARAVRDTGDTLDIDAEPLGLDEIASLSEDDVVRIYMDRSIPTLGPTTNTTVGTNAEQVGALLPLPSGSGLRPASFTGALVGQPVVVHSLSAQTAASFVGTVSPGIDEFSVAPALLLGNTNGLEIGARLDFSTEIRLGIHGTSTASEPFVNSEQTLASRWVVLPIGGIPVPFEIALSIGIACSANLSVAIDTTIAFRAAVRAGGSFVIDPRAGTDPSTWVRGGSWPNELTVDGSVGDDGTFDPSLGLSCQFPRLIVSATPVGKLGGAYVAVGPGVRWPMTGDAPVPAMFATLSAGVWGKVLGKQMTVEVVLLRWQK
jgi:hypothetical protein